MSPWVFVIVIVAVALLAVDGGMSTAAAVDRWQGTIVIGGNPIAFTVLINPGVSATWEWRFRGVQLASGFLTASVSGSTVTGTLFTTGGVVFQPGACCAPCNFSGTVNGNQAQGTGDAATCGEASPWVLTKQ
jgi:hypothetical protein